MAVFPFSLQQRPESSKYRENLQNNHVVSEFDSGPAKVRQKSTKSVTEYSVSILGDSDDLDTFEAFYKTTLSYGTAAFEWIDFRSGAAKEYRFVPGTSYQISNIGGDYYRISFQIEETL